MKLTTEMKERIANVGGKWNDEGDGYYSLIGKNSTLGFALVYIKLPKGHPDTKIRDYDEIDVEVNGGVTFKNKDIIGWDYGHWRNYSSPLSDIKNALKYFKDREKKRLEK